MLAIPIAVLAAGCLMPPPVQEVSAPQNQPPRILKDSLSPFPAKGPYHLNTYCERYTYNAPVTDPDPDDRLYWRVFLDYATDSRPGDAVGGDTAPKGDTVQLSFSVSPTDARFGGRLLDPHLIELFVSDRPFYTDSRDPLGRAVPEDALTDSAIWTVLLEQGQEQSPCEPQ